MIDDLLFHVAASFSFTPDIKNRAGLRVFERIVVGGMGGSHLGADLINAIEPEHGLSVHADYGLPPLKESAATRTLYIASSYSGDTEETVDFAERAIEKNYSLAVIAGGGKLLSLAKEAKIPYIKLPRESFPPRTAVGLSAIALAALIRREALQKELSSLAKSLRPEEAGEAGNNLARTLLGRIPLVYSSRRYLSLAYYWKITLNETAKIPACFNYVPEANHNEIEGFDGSSLSPRAPFHALLLKDPADHARVLKRMHITEEIYTKRGIPVTIIPVVGTTACEKVFGSVLRSIALALALAKGYGNEPMETPLITRFKKRLESQNV